MLYQVISRLIDRGTITDLRNKIDVLYAYGSLTDEEYGTLIERLGKI